MEKVFFEIPVYKSSEEQYHKKLNAFLEPHQESIKKNIWLEDYYRKSFGGTWLYNGIIGYRRLYIFMGNQIRIEYWQIDGKNLSTIKRKVFKYNSQNFCTEIHLTHRQSNQQILVKINAVISEAKVKLKKWHIDTSTFDEIAKHVDWKELISSNRYER